MDTKKFKIYIANLTHDYIALAHGTFPLGAGYVASALKTYFKDIVDYEVFKYSYDLENSIQSQIPDAFLFSTYVWTHNLPSVFARELKKISPDILIIGGGPNISKDPEKQKQYLLDNEYIDFFVLYEGESAACYIIEKYLSVGKDINALKYLDLPSTITLLPNGEFKSTPISTRIGISKKENFIKNKKNPFDYFSNLNDVPSPYLNGIMDKFFDNKLYPLIETNRGCPFSCSFCQQGEGYFTKIAFRDLDNVKNELNHIAKKMTDKSPGIFHIEIADPNFAMYPQDLKICEEFRKLQDKYKWPRFIGCSTGKNQPERILNAVSKLYPDSLLVSNSMQSTNEKTLEAIKRKNINLDGYSKVQTEIHKRGLRSMADVILGLPLETKESHFQAVLDLIDNGVQEFTSYQAMVLKSTDLELEQTKRKYGLKTKWRMMPRSSGEYKICGNNFIITETEEIIVSTNTLSFNDYLDSRRLHFITMVYHNSKIFNIITTYLKQENIKISTFINNIYDRSKKTNFAIDNVISEFIKLTKLELFKTENDCLNFYNSKKNLDRVKKSEIGHNLLYAYLTVCLFQYWDETVKVAINSLNEISNIDPKQSADFRKILNARIIDIRSSEMEKTINITLNSKKTKDFLNKNKFFDNILSNDNFKMKLSDYNYEILENTKNVYPNNKTGWSLILAMNRPHSVIRTFEI